MAAEGCLKPTPEQIAAARTAAGGWRRDTLESWGVSWPPQKGWRRELEGRPEYPDEMPPLQTIGQAARQMLPHSQLSAMVSQYTESPIETILGVHLLLSSYGFEFRLPNEDPKGWSLIPQMPWRRYRIDWTIISPASRVAFVECDGQEFHSSPEQIERDRRRDAEANEAGIPVFRFSGSDICASPSRCIGDIASKFIWGQK